MGKCLDLSCNKGVLHIFVIFQTESLVQKPMMDELEMRKQKLKDRVASLNLEREEVGKSMDSAEKSLQEIVGCSDWDTTRFFIEEDRNAHREPEAIVQKQKADRQEVEDFYVAVSFRKRVFHLTYTVA